MHKKINKFISPKFLKETKVLYCHFKLTENRQVLNIYKRSIINLGLFTKILINTNNTHTKYITDEILKKKAKKHACESLRALTRLRHITGSELNHSLKTIKMLEDLLNQTNNWSLKEEFYIKSSNSMDNHEKILYKQYTLEIIKRLYQKSFGIYQKSSGKDAYSLRDLITKNIQAKIVSNIYNDNFVKIHLEDKSDMFNKNTEQSDIIIENYLDIPKPIHQLNIQELSDMDAEMINLLVRTPIEEYSRQLLEYNINITPCLDAVVEFSINLI